MTFDQVQHLIPWGTQTNAKRPDPSLMDVMPLFVERAEGCRFQDTLGRWFLDYRSALGPIILGYNHPEVQEAVQKQLEKGTLFSMASPLEYEVAEILCGMIEGFEQVRFTKTGNEANACATRLARAFTKREKIITVGYHGHGDWFACGNGDVPTWWHSANNGVPKALNDLVFRVAYNDFATIEAIFAEHGNDIAAVIAVPFDWNEIVGHEFVHGLRRITSQNGALLIFDQVLTGFRLAKGGAQEYFGVIPDLSTYAKALANGFPLAAFGGKKDVMQMLDEVILTSTYWGETLSLAAAKATLTMLQNAPVLEHIWRVGTYFQEQFNAMAEKNGFSATCYGLPPAPQIRLHKDSMQHQNSVTAFHRVLLEARIFPSSPYLLNYAHQNADVDETILVMEKALFPFVH